MRLIDEDNNLRTRPMRLLVLGLSRTGTSSIGAALKMLGYKTFHMTEVCSEYFQPRHESDFFKDAGPAKEVLPLLERGLECQVSWSRRAI
jgi:hypothetical protein